MFQEPQLSLLTMSPGIINAIALQDIFCESGGVLFLDNFIH